MAATGLSQIEFLQALAIASKVNWSKTSMYHLDEYVGLPESHPASFRHYLRERLISRVHPGTVRLIDGNVPNPLAECERLNKLLSEDKVDVAFLGIGENAHLAFNDPPADFDTDVPFVVVELAETCRTQQVNEGWFKALDDVPQRAITVTIRQILEADCIICVAPGRRNADAVKCALSGPITPSCPASALRKHSNVHVYLDIDSTRLLDQASIAQYQAVDS